ncbi:MAG: phenylalanine--tRNA ligase subunit alpha [Thermodesulfovibrionales bacterium]|nr:phenylalanine--tRNA ligase subunit alpha [Thermodesulfovibrionales bacterium]
MLYKEIADSFNLELDASNSIEDINRLKVKYLGKKGIITEALKGMSSLAPQERPTHGQALNQLKREIEDLLSKREEHLKQIDITRRQIKESLDITLPGNRIPIGSLHPINLVLDEIVDIFVSMGFDIEDGPEVELDYYNFEALNIPKDHPARDMQDTFYITEDIVLRTQTSPVQVRAMQKSSPPLRFISPGKVYRCDSDISHTPMFHQVEGLMVDTDITFSYLKGVIEVFLKEFFGRNVSVRFRPSFFPFTEPSAEVDIGCIICKGQGCRVCKETGWLEVMGAGMVHPKVFENVGYDTSIYKGFAFGMGVERLTMLRYSITDIRLFFENDIRFLEQF